MFIVELKIKFIYIILETLQKELITFKAIYSIKDHIDLKHSLYLKRRKNVHVNSH